MKSLMRRIAILSLAALPIAFFAGQAHALLVVTVAFSGQAAQTFTDTDGDGIVQALANDGSGSSIVAIGTSDTDRGVLRDTQVIVNIEEGVSGTVTITDDGFTSGTTPAPVFTTVSTPTQVTNLDLDLSTSVDGVVVLTANDLVGTTTYSDAIKVATGANFSISHTWSFVAVGGRGTGSADTTTRIPEPSMAALLGIGLVGFGFARRKKLNSK